MKKNLFKAVFLGALALFAWSANAENTYYSSSTTTSYPSYSCTITRDLMLGMYGEDIRCLQQFLRDSGVSFSNYMYPDGSFGPLTERAVMEWQAKHGLAVTGYFDGASRTTYIRIVGENDHIILPPGTSSQEQKAINRIKDALVMIEDAEEEVEDNSTDKAEELLEDAKDNMLAAARAYFMERNYSKAYSRANDAFRDAEDAFEEAGGNSGDREDAKDAIDEAEEAIEEAKEEIRIAKAGGKNVNTAEDRLEDAEELLEDAEDEYDDRNYDDAEELAKDAKDKAEDAIDAIGGGTGGGDREEAEEAINDAEEAIDDARDEIEEAEDDGDDVDEAEELLEDAENKLEDAEEEFEDEDYDRAIDLAEDAEELADDAVEAID